jgi:poly-gamma-glutamate synthesis protein (capsule biosynthesis protein)
MKYMVNKKGIIISKVFSVIFWNQFRYPQPIRGRYDIANNKFEKIKWAYKCWIKQTEVAEKNSGIENYFSNQDLRFMLPEGFVEESSITLSAGGDLMAVDAISYESTSHLFDDINDFYLDADITCANLESTVYDKAPIGRNQVPDMPAKMNTSLLMLDRFLKNGNGIDYFSTANNHCYDYGEEGLTATINNLKDKKCYFYGTNMTPEEQDDVLIIEKNGVKIAMLSYTFDMNGNTYEKKHLINEVRFNDENVDITLVKKHVSKARKRGADIIVASCHWGWEFEMYPHKSTIDIAHQLADEGIDVILGSHPHVAQPMERYESIKGNKKRQCLIIYSLGDFVSYHPLSKNSKITYTVRFKISNGILNNEPFTQINELEILPVYILAEEKSDDVYYFRLLKFKDVLDKPESYGLTDEDRSDLERLDKHVLKKILLPLNWKQ